MSTEAHAINAPSPSVLADARQVLRLEGQALLSLANRLDAGFERALKLLLDCRGVVLVTGIGKAGLIGRKVSATFASLGIPSHFLHATEAIHGDLGSVRAVDVVLALSASGQTEEVVRVASLARERGTRVVAITGQALSRLGRTADSVLELGSFDEAGGLQLAPTTSTTMMLALGDALALVLSQQRRYRAEDFASNHPGGALGRQLTRVEQVMRPLGECRVARQDATVREAFIRHSVSGQRSGAVMVVDDSGHLAGIFTDSDLARLLECKRDDALDRPIEEVMTHGPQTVRRGEWLSEAIQALAARKISELPVVDDVGVPLGLIDITDVVAVVPSNRGPLRESAEPTRDEDGIPAIISFPSREGA